MAQYYHNPFGGGGRNPKPGRSLWMAIADIVMWLVSLLTAVAFIIIIISRYISPENLWYFSLVGFGAPFIYICLLISTLYWIIRWRWSAAAVMALFAFAGFFYVSLYYKLDLTREYEEPKYDRSAIKVLTYNVRYFYNDSYKDSSDSVERFILSERPDIICFQEFPTNKLSDKEYVKGLRSYNASNKTISKSHISVECFSRYPIIAADSISGLQGGGIAMWADLRIDDDTVRVYNVHLQSTSIKKSDSEYLSHREFITDTTREERFLSIAKNLMQNNIRRAQEVRCIRRHMDECPYPAILCGDFNDIPISYAARTLSRGMKDSFREQGKGYANTYRGFFDLLRIDYILASPQFETLSYDVCSGTAFSDHYPVTARLKLTQKQ